MIKRIELQHKVKYFDKEYSVMLHNGSDFTTAFNTLQYLCGITTDTEQVLISADPMEYNEIFIENGHRVIHFYSDENDFNEKRKEFVDNIFAKYNINKLYIFLVIPIDYTVNQVHDILNDFKLDDEYCYISLITDSRINKASVRIVIGV